MDLNELGAETVARHPWEVARSHFFQRVLKQIGATRTSEPILDVGAGDAWFAEQLALVLPEATPITCWDVNYSDEPSSATQGVVLTADRPTSRFHGLLMLDVIEHVEHDAIFVRSIVRDLLDNDGWALVSVPAYQWLFTSHDTALHHFRRYSPTQCRAILESAGLQTVVEGGLFQSLLLIRMLQAAREWAVAPAPSHGIGAWKGGELLTNVMTKWLDLEGTLSFKAATKTNFVPPGLSFWAYCVPSKR